MKIEQYNRLPIMTSLGEALTKLDINKNNKYLTPDLKSNQKNIRIGNKIFYFEIEPSVALSCKQYIPGFKSSLRNCILEK